jgi:hypothetical protein
MLLPFGRGTYNFQPMRAEEDFFLQKIFDIFAVYDSMIHQRIATDCPDQCNDSITMPAPRPDGKRIIGCWAQVESRDLRNRVPF